MMFISITSFGQIFNGIEVGKPLDETKNTIKNKGFIFLKNLSDDIAQYSGMINGESVVISIVSTPKTKIVWKLNVKISTRYDWNSIKNEFYKYSKTLTDKYDEPKNKYEFFSSPYKEGDDFEMLAIKSNKCNYYYVWVFEKYSIGLQIVSTKYGEAYINISYENDYATTINDVEKGEINKRTF